MGLGVRAVANERRKKKSPSRGHSFSLSSRPLVCAFPFFVSGTVPKDLDPSLLSLSTVSLLLSKRRRDRRDPIQARDDPELASQTKKRQSIVSSSSHQAKEKKNENDNGPLLQRRVRQPQGLLLRQLRHLAGSRREPRQQGERGSGREGTERTRERKRETRSFPSSDQAEASERPR